MYKRYFSDGSWNPDFFRGLDSFIEFARSQTYFMDRDKIRCPCRKCKNIPFRDSEEVMRHVLARGFDWHYHIWCYQGETSIKMSEMIARIMTKFKKLDEQQEEGEEQQGEGMASEQPGEGMVTEQQGEGTKETALEQPGEGTASEQPREGTEGMALEQPGEGTKGMSSEQQGEREETDAEQQEQGEETDSEEYMRWKESDRHIHMEWTDSEGTEACLKRKRRVFGSINLARSVVGNEYSENSTGRCKVDSHRALSIRVSEMEQYLQEERGHRKRLEKLLREQVKATQRIEQLLTAPPPSQPPT